MATIRQQITALLQKDELTALEISALVGRREKEVVEHLEHIRRSLKGQGLRLVVQASHCQQCGYLFKERQRLSRPGRCPGCKGSHLSQPVFTIV